MIALFIFAILLIAILLYLIAAPFYIEVNSEKDLYRIRFHKLATARVYVANASLFLELHVIGWKKRMDLLQTRQPRVVKKELSGEKNRRTIPTQKIYAVAKSFKLTKCVVSLDTGDMALNGVLYPILLWMGTAMGKNIEINFYNQNVVELQIQNNFYRVFRAYLRN